MGSPPPSAVLAGQAIVDHWPAGTRICRAHPHLFGSAGFDTRSDADSRFSTIRLRRTVIPVLYGGENDMAAASETIFHTVDTPAGAHRPRRVPLTKYRSWQWSEVITTRQTELVRLDDHGLAAIGISRAELIEGGRGTYSETRTWAQALATALPDTDGMWWESRQAPEHWAVMLFGYLRSRPAGISGGDLTADGPAVPFASVEGLHRLDEIAETLDITVIRG